MGTSWAPGADAPSESSLPAGRACRRCGAVAEVGEDRCRRCRSFLPGSAVRLVHGGRRLQAGRSPVDLHRVEQIRAEIETDLGGAGSLSAASRALVADLAFAVVLRDLLAAHIASVGPLTSRNARRAALDGWRMASDRVERLAARVGLGRRAKRLPSLAEALDAVEVEANA